MILLNVASFLASTKYNKGFFKINNTEIQDDLLSDKEEINDATQVNNKNEESEEKINSSETVNKFMSFIEKEEETKNLKSTFAKSTSSDDENPCEVN